MISLVGKSNGEFYSLSNCQASSVISDFTIIQGSGIGRFYYKDPIAEALNFIISDADTLIDTSIATYSNNGAPVDNGADLQFTVEYHPSSDDVSVSWTGFTDDDLSDHELFLYTSSDCSTGEVSHGLTSSSSNSNNTVIDGVPDGIYYGRVRAIDGFSNSTLSSCSSDFITIDTTNPTDLGANPLLDDSYDLDGDNIGITWNAFFDINLSEYEILSYTDSNCTLNEISYGRVDDSNLYNNTLIDNLSDSVYWFKIRAIDLAGNTTDSSCSTNFVTVDSVNPTDPIVDDPPSGRTVPTIPITWTDSFDVNFKTHNIKACLSNDCSTSCEGEDTDVASGGSLSVTMNNTYYICVQGEDLSGRKSNWVSSTNSVLVFNHSPELVAIADQNDAAENSPITTIDIEDVSGGDTDLDGEANTYTCVYDTSVNGAVSPGSDCSLIDGFNLDASTGVINWTPGWFQAGSYEFEITATSFDNKTDTDIFVILVANTDRAPSIDPIGDANEAEGTAIATIDINDINSGADIDIDNEAITYSCVYDQVIDGVVNGNNTCSDITGFSINSSTGVINWTPGYFQAGDYEFKITASAFTLSDDDVFSIVVANTDRPPVIKEILDVTTDENLAITPVNADDQSGGDTDIDNETITYSCFYDINIDSTVGTDNSCDSLQGVANFDTATGILTWVPDFFAYETAPVWEIRIRATVATLFDDEIFTITVNSVDRAPEIAPISDANESEGVAISTIDAYDINSGVDLDIDNETITYSCYFDNDSNSSVANINSCDSLPGVATFDTATGVLNWTPGYFTFQTSAVWEFKIIATVNTLSDDEFFVINIANTDRSPEIVEILDQPSAAEGTAITTVDATDTSGGDTDIDNEVVTYSCFFDNTNNLAVDNTNSCDSLPGVSSFEASTGILNWTPGYFTAQTSNTWEFRITADANGLTDDEFFVVTVANTDRFPVLVEISNLPSEVEGTAIPTIDATDTSGGDTDIDNEAITYSCYFDNEVNSTVLTTNACSSLPGTASFDTATGILEWTPGYFTAQTSNNWEFRIIADVNGLTDEKFFVINVANTDRAPLLKSISNQPSAAEDSAIITVDAEDFNTNSDNDIDLEAITYSCVYDTVLDGSVDSGSICTSIGGVSFNNVTGVMNWTPGFFQSGDYEFKITGSVGTLSDSKIFTINVANTDRPPVLVEIADQPSVVEGTAIATVDANDTSGGDTDIDTEPITYTCFYDNVDDADVLNTNACSSLPGTANFDTTTGVLTWIPGYFTYQASDTWEIKITGTSTTLSDDQFFVITVANTNRPPVLVAIEDTTVDEDSAMTTINANDANSNGDTDIDTETISYLCFYDTNEDGNVLYTNLCSSLPGTASFDNLTGILEWTPSYDANTTNNSIPKYEVIITATATGQSDSEIFTINVNNVDRHQCFQQYLNKRLMNLQQLAKSMQVTQQTVTSIVMTIL